ncbi:hypothetical protein H4Q26_017085 [Puccinia striiformis f. sp. tritici PST-130]|nr:hypothetical protein H4Q26_017085 [Puccinia striiformis f. sp. tritici PST-130]
MTNRLLNTSCIFAIACLQATSIHGIIFPDAPLAVHDVEAGRPYATHEDSFLGSPSGPMQIPGYISTISSSLEDTREDHQLAPDLASEDDWISWEQLLHEFESSGSLSTEPTDTERRHTPEFPAPPHTLKSPPDELTVEDHSTLGLIGWASDAEQLNCESLPFLFGSPQSLPTMPPELNYVDNLHLGEYATGVKWPTNLIEEPVRNLIDEPVSRSSPLKRKSVDNLDGPPPNQLARPRRKILVNDRELSRTSQTTSKSDDSGLTHHREHSLGKHMASDGHQSDSVDMLGGNLKRYGILNTLHFPGRSSWDHKLFSRNVLHESALWKFLQTSCEDSTVPILVQKIIQSGVVSRPTALENARNLLEEIFLRYGQFLIAFTKCETIAESRENYDVIELRSQEQEKLLEWLTSLLNSEKQPETSHDEDSTARLQSFSLCQEMLCKYLGREDMKLNYLATAVSDSDLYRAVTHTSAMKTQVAINAIGSYLEYINPNHWEDLSMDNNFLKLFTFLKRLENSRSLSKVPKTLFEWKKLKLVPWDNKQRIKDDVEGRNMIKKFKSRMAVQIWHFLERDYKEVDNPGHKDETSTTSCQYIQMDWNPMFHHASSPFLKKPGALLEKDPGSGTHKFINHMMD